MQLTSDSRCAFASLVGTTPVFSSHSTGYRFSGEHHQSRWTFCPDHSSDGETVPFYPPSKTQREDKGPKQKMTRKDRLPCAFGHRIGRSSEYVHCMMVLLQYICQAFIRYPYYPFRSCREMECRHPPFLCFYPPWRGRSRHY